MCVFGVIISAIAGGFFKFSALGVDPFQILTRGTKQVIDISYGLLYIILNCIFLIFSFVANRKYIGLATFINLFFFGYITDFTNMCLLAILPSTIFIQKVIAMALGILLICIGSAFYYVADLGVSTYDAIALILAHTWKVGQFKYLRIICDCICVSAGSALFLVAGGTVAELFTIIGIGTILIAFCMGPLIDFFIRKLAQPFLGENKVEVIHEEA